MALIYSFLDRMLEECIDNMLNAKAMAALYKSGLNHHVVFRKLSCTSFLFSLWKYMLHIRYDVLQCDVCRVFCRRVRKLDCLTLAFGYQHCVVR